MLEVLMVLGLVFSVGFFLYTFGALIAVVIGIAWVERNVAPKDQVEAKEMAVVAGVIWPRVLFDMLLDCVRRERRS